MPTIAIIGLGAATDNIHLPAYRQIRSCVKVVAGCDIDAGARAKMAAKLPRIYSSPEEMIATERPDIVSVCTPPFCHREHCLLALAHGCHVFCEKPMAESLEEADEVIEAAAKAGCQVVINSEFPYMKIHAAAKAAIGTEHFGRLLFIHAWQTFCPTQKTEAGWRGRMQRRLCFEFGVHVLELIRFFTEDEPVKLFCHIPSLQSTSKEDVNMISLWFADGRAASIVLDRLSKGPESYLAMRLDGEHAAINTSIGGEARLEMGIHAKIRRPFCAFRFVKGGKAILQNGYKTTILAQDGFNPFAYATAVHLQNFIEALQKGTTPKGIAKDHRKTLALVLACYDSAERQTVVELRDYWKDSER